MNNKRLFLLLILCICGVGNYISQKNEIFKFQIDIWLLFGVISVGVYFLLPKLYEKIVDSWQRLGNFLGLLSTPIVWGWIFFGLITPLSLILRIFGRDKLDLRSKNKKTLWTINSNKNLNNFEDQF